MRRAAIVTALLPAMQKIHGALQRRQSPYADLLGAVHSVVAMCGTGLERSLR
jgi:hypothetical protein